MSTTILSPLARRILVAAALGVGVVSMLGATGCGSTADQTETAASPEATPAATPAAESTAPTGPGGFFLKAVDALPLRADQQQSVAAIRADLHTAMAPVRAARAALGAETARQVRAGAIDQSRLQPLADQVAAAAGAGKPAIQQAVQKIHDLLDASQRQALVASVRDKVGQGGHLAAMKDHMEKVATELGLTADQRTSIKAQVHTAFAAQRGTMHADHAAMKARMETLAAAFETDTFDAKALDVGEHGADGATHLMGMHGAFLQAAVPVLTPAQREILVTKIQARTQSAED
jgi:LTXXQ motif family protein